MATKVHGSCRSTRKIGEVSYQVEVAPSIPRAHNVIHVSRLKPYVRDKMEKGVDVVADPDGNVEQEYESIIKHQGR